MARAIWNGSISFGLVNIPIKLYNAVSRKGVSFNQIDARTNKRIKMQRVNAEGEEVPYEQIVKGYQIAPDQYVLVDPDELDALDPEKSSTVDIEEFVDLADIDPIFFDSAYYLAPGKSAEKPYALLARAMEENGKVALARFVMRTKQYLAAVRARDGMLLLSTMVYADEVVPPEEMPELDGVEDIKVSQKELAMAGQLIDSLSAEFEPERYRDTYRDQVMELIERKAAGEEITIEPVAEADATKVVDLMAALEASVAGARSARKRHPTGADADADVDEADEEDDEDVAPAKKQAAKKKAAPAKRARKSA